MKEMANIELLKQYDPEIGNAMDDELARQRRNLELIASENIVSEPVMAAMGSVLTNKYAEGLPGKRYYGGCQCVDVVENIARARAGKGPTLIECKTYRWMGHWTGDPQPYRTKEEINEWKKKCPIKYTRALLENMGVPAQQLDEIENKAQALIDEAETFALNSPEPDPAHVLDDVFYDGGEN